MLVTPDLLADLALLSSLSVLVHYFFGLYGIVAAVAGVSLLEHGAEIAAATLDKVSRYGHLKSAIARQAASAVATIRRRRPTRSHGANDGGKGDGATWRNDGDNDENDDREQTDGDAGGDDDIEYDYNQEAEEEEEEARDGDPRALLERFSTVGSDLADDFGEQQQQQQQRLQRNSGVMAARDDSGSEESVQSSEDPSSRLVIRDIGSCYNDVEDDEATEATATTDTADDQREQLPEQDADPDADGTERIDVQQPSTAASRVNVNTSNLMQMNSHEPIAFETELFQGHVYFFVRTNPEDPHWRHLFHDRRRMFWIQVQGTFKRAPKGTVYLGGELPSQISPGIFTRSIAHVIMGIIQQLVGSVNFSFGDAKNEVVPSIALPLYQSADQLVVTPAGGLPPPLGERDFGETEAARRLRRQTPLGSEKYVVGDTYSFDFHTMYVDLSRWRTANLPGLSEMELSSFFDSLPLRMVAYDVCATPFERHLQQQKDYLFKFEVKYDRTGGHNSSRDTSDSSNSISNVRTARDARQTRRRGRTPSMLERTESENSEETVSVAGVMSTDGSGGMSTVVSEASSFDDQTLVLDEVLFLNQENARRLAKLSFAYLCWLEEVDVASGVRRVQYVFSVKRKEDGGDHRLAVVSAYALKVLLFGRYKGGAKKLKKQLTMRAGGDNAGNAGIDNDVLLQLSSLRFHSQSRIGSYSTISDEAFVIAQCLQKLVNSKIQSDESVDGNGEMTNGEELTESVVDDDGTNSSLQDLVFDEDVAFQSAFYQCLTQRNQLQAPQSTNLSCSPSKLGVNLSKREREDMRVVFEGVVYRYYSESLLRQEVLFVTPDELLFYRSYSTSAEKHVACSRVIGVQAIKLPCAEDVYDKCAFVFQINTFAEEIVLCVGTEHARNTWIRVILQHCQPQDNFDRSLLADQQMHICYAASKPLKPANRINLNARSLFPRRQPSGGVIPKITPEDALQIAKKTLTLALRIHSRLETSVAVVEILEFLSAASELRNVDLDALQHECSHEAKMAFYLNLYHAVLAHAMISHGFPRSKGQWDFFLTHMCYSVGLRSHCNGTPTQVSLSLAEIEHVILRNRMPQADLPHLNFSKFIHGNSMNIARLEGLGVAHPDFRLIFALAMNQSEMDEQASGSGGVVVYEPERVHDQLNAIAQSLLKDVQVDTHISNNGNNRRDTILLPRICEWYRMDFGGGGSPLNCVRKVLGFLDDRVQHQALDALEDPLATRIKFRAFKYAPKAKLQGLELHEATLRPVVAPVQENMA